ncbi:MAG: M42 family metallopeptidase [Oscillospiraceae bacterium]|nr:M42 family metallopeptidase [Oscillospiraceae bacterium]
MLDRFKTICSIDGTSGDESAVRDYIRSNITADEVTVDNLGNLIVFKKGKKTPENKIMLAAHMDEVGFMVTDVTEDGFLRFGAVGGVDPRVVIGRAVRFKNSTIGVVGTKATHQLSADERKKAPDFTEMYIDIGASTRAEAEKLVSRGDTACFDSDFFSFGDGFIKGKAIDDRAGCLIMMDMINSELEYDMWFAFTVQEEVGTRGAKAASFTVAPDIALVLETTTACDIAGVGGDKRVCQLGKGCVVSYMDRSTVYDRELYKLAFETAEKLGVPVQTKTVVAGGNDSGAIHVSRSGVRTCALSVPCRYLHSPSCVIKQSDYEATKALAAAMANACAVL